MLKYKTLAIDSASELARIFFSWEMKAPDNFLESMEVIRTVKHYPGATERLNKFVRRLKDFRDAGLEVVITAHEDIQKVYPRGGIITAKGEAPREPVSIKGLPDMPGDRCPEEVCRAADNIFRVRYVNGKPAWIANLESIGPDCGMWQCKDRFGARTLNGGIFPPSYEELLRIVLESKQKDHWFPPFIWVLYGPFGIGKTRSLLTFPRPIKILDIDDGTKSIQREIKAGEVDVVKFKSEKRDEYSRILAECESCLNSR